MVVQRTVARSSKDVHKGFEKGADKRGGTSSSSSHKTKSTPEKPLKGDKVVAAKGKKPAGKGAPQKGEKPQSKIDTLKKLVFGGNSRKAQPKPSPQKKSAHGHTTAHPQKGESKDARSENKKNRPHPSPLNTAAKTQPAAKTSGKNGPNSGGGVTSLKKTAHSALVGRIFDPTSAESVCREVACEGLATSGGYCRLHYIKNWKKIKRKEVILREKKLNQYIEELVAKYPDKYIEAIRQDLASDKDFAKVIYDLDLDEGVDEFESEGGDSVDSLIDSIKRDFDDESDSF